MSLTLFPSETVVCTDRYTGVRVRQLTNHKAHSHHLYFTNPGWWDSGRRLVFGSDRGNRTNLFSVELESGKITQITDADMPGPPDETSFLFASVNPHRDEAYFWRGRDLIAVGLRTGVERTLHRLREGYTPNMTNVSADGKYVLTCAYEQREGVALLRGYLGFREYFESRPHSFVLRADVASGTTEIVHEDHNWIGHVNTSPTQPHLLTFCHEGPWARVQQRIWGLDHTTGKTWKIRPQSEGEQFGHEYWMADGVTVGYHGTTPAGKVYGAIRYDNTHLIEAAFPFDNNHYHSLDLDLVGATLLGAAVPTSQRAVRRPARAV
jgi:oligogalacturonide lyase